MVTEEEVVYAVVPPKVEYSLIELGASLIEPLTVLCRWAEQHLWEVQAARVRSGDAAN
jgi:DNA-binding HxlR family transcriptional regulator